MRVRLLFALLCILALPALFAPSRDYQRAASAPFGVVAVAGHTLPGAWCECGSPGCICDPGEVPVGNTANPSDDGPVGQDPAPIDDQSAPVFPLGSGALLVTLTLMLWFRMRV